MGSGWVSNEGRAGAAPTRWSAPQSAELVRGDDPALAGAALAGSERQLLDAAQRLARRPQGWTALALHLSRLCPPAPRPHHRRIAHAMLQDAARRHDGQVHALRNGDIVLLCRTVAPPPGGPPRAAGLPLDPAALSGTLARLLQADAPDQSPLISVWPLEQAQDALLSYASACLTDGMAAPAAAPDAPAQVGTVGALGSSIAGGEITGLVQRQIGVVVTSSRGRPLAAMQPLYSEVTFPIAALEARLAAGGTAEADPYLFCHLAVRLDARMLALLRREIGTGSPLDAAAPRAFRSRPAPALHVNLTLPGIVSPGFAQFAAAAHAAAASVGIEVALVEACADPTLFARAGRVVREAGMTLVLDGVSHLSLLLSCPATLQPDVMKLDWSPRLLDLRAEERNLIAATLEQQGPDAVVLHHADTEAALRWGLAEGIHRFQGRHVDAMLAAGRMLACPSADGCTLRQCSERAAATEAAGRSLCRNTRLLDAAVADPVCG